MINKSFEEILASIRERIGGELYMEEGSYTDTLIRAVAMEIADSYFDQQALLPIAFVNETSGSYIDKRAAEYGILRKTGTRAKAAVRFAGQDGKKLPTGTAVQTASGLVFLTDKDATVTDGSAVVPVTAEKAGAIYNVAENAITTLQSAAGVSVTGSSAAEGGTDDETDEALLTRLYAYWQKPATSGNAHQYEEWALEVEGIGAAKIYPTWNGGGTVKVVIIDSNMEPPTEDKVKEVESHIETVRPICVDVTVEPATKTEISVVAKVQLEESTTAEEVQEAFQALLETYCRDIAFQHQTVVYNRIAYMLLSIDGVIDFTSLTLNGGTSNIVLADNAVPAVGTVTVT